MSMAVFWIVTSCGLADEYQPLTGTASIFRAEPKPGTVCSSEKLVPTESQNGITTQKIAIDYNVLRFVYA
jgi:hypothetical protein